MLDHQGLRLRAALFQAIRDFFTANRFLEVVTPIRQPVVIPEHTISPMSAEDWYLQASPELCMKRLLGQGEENIFQLAPCFRRNERGRIHLEEFIMLEWYRVGCDYRQLMEDCQNLLRSILRDLKSQTDLSSLLSKSRLTPHLLEGSWEYLSVSDGFRSYSPISMEQALAEDRFEEMLVDYIEPQLGRQQPTFFYDYPAACSSLARLKPEEPDVAERFELYFDGLELANGFSELTDVQEQRFRFENERALIREREARDVLLPERFLDDLANIDTAAGIAFGVDRLLLLLMSKDTLSDVVPFAPDDW